jgi:MFS transporter, SHS family, lactate transporter
MATAAAPAKPIPWWKEPTKDQWYAWWAAWMGWTLDAFDFTVFLLIMVPIAEEFHVPLAAVAFVLTITLWMRLVGAVAAGWLADRVGRKTPLTISIAWYSLANFIAGFSPTLWFLLVFRALLGIGMGAEWPVGAALVMENWPQRSRGLMSGILQASGNLGFLLSSIVYGLLYNSIGWRGMLWLGVLPALSLIYIRYYVNEPPVWLENRRLQRATNREVRSPLFAIFRRGMIGNTMTACWFMASAFITYYSINSLFASHMQTDLKLSPALSGSFTVIVVALVLQGAAGSGGMFGQIPAYLNERFPTEVRATATAFCYHQGAIWGGLCAPVLAYFATSWQLGLAIPMLVGTAVGATSFIIALLVSPETNGTEMVADLVVI